MDEVDLALARTLHDHDRAVDLVRPATTTRTTTVMRLRLLRALRVHPSSSIDRHPRATVVTILDPALDLDRILAIAAAPACASLALQSRKQLASTILVRLRQPLKPVVWPLRNARRMWLHKRKRLPLAAPATRRDDRLLLLPPLPLLRSRLLLLLVPLPLILLNRRSSSRPLPLQQCCVLPLLPVAPAPLQPAPLRPRRRSFPSLSPPARRLLVAPRCSWLTQPSRPTQKPPRPKRLS